MKKLLETHQEITDQIFTLFGLENGYGELSIHLETKWDADDDNVRWISKTETYSNEIVRGPWISKDKEFTLYSVDNGCGDKYWQVFENKFKGEIENDW